MLLFNCPQALGHLPHGLDLTGAAPRSRSASRQEKARSTTAMGDLLVEAEAQEGRLRLNGDFPGWPDRTFEAYFAM